ncbi:hypothetical protein SAMN05660199_02900 [Klenkia soli]|uniref:Uncharacterized protein n=1 Tax=Klenkia soli TaxID=1052260 RepID=A0A1H0NXI2_9ACTN|nr:hypothetical protein [Klenkia soli]SDO97394.1 hypothetical protein SAMN05660199_02900 [Klenkia soli]
MRIRETLGAVDGPCLLCGSADVVAVRTRLARRGLARLKPGFDPDEHRYELCRGCGAKNLETPPVGYSQVP